MANKIVKYKLTDAGTIPTWIDDGGYYPDPSEVMIGATVDGSSEVGLGELASDWSFLSGKPPLVKSVKIRARV